MERPPDNDPTQPNPAGPDDEAAGPQSPGATSRPTGPQSPGPETGPTRPQSPGPESASTEPPPPGPEDAPSPKRLTRSSGDRMIGGVCGGIARYLGVDATVVRIATVVLALIGGAGALLYVAALLIMPSDSPAAGSEPGGLKPLAIVGVVLLLLVGWPFILGGGFMVAGLAVPLAILTLAGLGVWWLVSGEGPGGNGRDVARRAALGIAVLIGCGAIAIAGGLAAGLGGGTVVAALVILAGVMLVAGAFVGGVRWLIPPALSLALAVGFVSAAGIDLDGGVGERNYRPASADSLRESYRLGMGELVVDLRDVDLPAGDTPLALDVGIGAVRLIVPEDVCVASAAEVGIGGVDVLGRDNGGVDLDWEDRPRAAAGGSRVVVDAEVGVGALLVRHDDRSDPYEGPGGFGRFDDDGAGGDGNSGCRETRAAR